MSHRVEKTGRERRLQSTKREAGETGQSSLPIVAVRFKSIISLTANALSISQLAGIPKTTRTPQNDGAYFTFPVVCVLSTRRIVWQPICLWK